MGRESQRAWKSRVRTLLFRIKEIRLNKIDMRQESETFQVPEKEGKNVTLG